MSKEAEYTEGYVVESKGAPFKLREIPLAPLTATQVEVDMEYCGLCHTDILMQNNGWGISNFPMCPGHEGVGEVVRIGEDVNFIRVGDKVGVACKNCKHCINGEENICLKGYQGTYLSSNAGMWGKEDHALSGCFAKKMRVEERFTFKIPNNLLYRLAQVAPLLCAGCTMYSPLREHVTSTSHVGILGLGGLGHMGILFAHALGARVYGMSRTHDKEKRARDMGCHAYVVYTDDNAKNEVGQVMDIIIDTTPANVDPMVAAMPFLRPGGKYVKVGIPPGDGASITVPTIPLVFCQYSVQGSIVSGSKYTYEMLELASISNITADVEVIPFHQINEGVERLTNAADLTKFRFTLAW